MLEGQSGRKRGRRKFIEGTLGKGGEGMGERYAGVRETVRRDVSRDRGGSEEEGRDIFRGEGGSEEGICISDGGM